MDMFLDRLISSVLPNQSLMIFNTFGLRTRTKEKIAYLFKSNVSKSRACTGLHAQINLFLQILLHYMIGLRQKRNMLSKVLHHL